MTIKQIKKLLPKGIINFVKEQKEVGGNIEFEFDKFLLMDIRTISGKKIIVAAKYLEDDIVIDWYYLGGYFYIKINNILVTKVK